MASSRARIIVTAGIVSLVAIGGIFWLISAATGGGGNGKSVGQEATIDPTAEGGSSAGQPNGPDARSTGPGGSLAGRPNNGRHGIHWNGVRLDGNEGDDGCVTIINKTGTDGVVESVSFTVIGGPGGVAVRADNAHCTDAGDPPCNELALQAGDQCSAGAVLSGHAAPGHYTLRANVNYRYVCVNVESSPCDEVRDWQGSPPTSGKPVEFSGTTSNNVPPAEIFVEGRSSPSAEPTLEPTPEQSLDESPESVPQDTGASPEAE
jgi:hypothetical protein